MASGPSELASVVAFSARHLARRLTGGRGGEQAVLRLGGAYFAVGLRGGESSVFREILLDRVYERAPSFKLRAGDTVVDVGANIGVFTVMQGRRGAQVYAFEPNPDCFARLTRNLASNNLGARVRAFNLALGERESRGWLSVQAGTVQGTVALEPPAVPGAVPVPVSTLDAVLRPFNLAAVDLLKVDAEGSEAAVLCGASKTLQRTRRVVLEYHSEELRQRVERLLSRAGFRLVLDDPGPLAGMGHAFYARAVRTG